MNASAIAANALAPTVAAQTAEFSAIRAEICAFHAVEGQVMQITIAFMGVLAGALAVADYRPFLHVIPIPFVALGIVFAYTQARIVQSASYIPRKLREQVISVLGAAGGPRTEIWNWEVYRRSHECPIRMLATWLNGARWLFFIIPSLFPLTVWQREFHSVGDVLLLAWDCLLPLALFIIAIWSSTLLPGRVLQEK